MPVPGFTAERSLYRSTLAYSSLGKASADMTVSMQALGPPQGGYESPCTRCKSNCDLGYMAGTASCILALSLCQPALGWGIIPCLVAGAIYCGYLNVLAQHCYDNCSMVCSPPGVPPPGGGESGGAPMPYCVRHPEKCTPGGTPIPDPGCVVYGYGGGLPECPLASCCYSQVCTGKPGELLGCRCGACV
jgi:hypothetical protein